MVEVIERLVEMAQDSNLNPTQRATCADAADLLGYQPDDIFRFIPIIDPNSSGLSIGKYPVTNFQYSRFVEASDFAKKEYWTDSPKFDESSVEMEETWNDECWDWLQRIIQSEHVDKLLPSEWNNKLFGIFRRCAPVVGISWFEAMAYCKWLHTHWEDLDEGKESCRPQTVRLLTRKEWILAAGGDTVIERFPWDTIEKADPIKENEEKIISNIIRRANIDRSDIWNTTPVWMFPQGASNPYGLMDMGGNIWEWQANYFNLEKGHGGLSGGSWKHNFLEARVSSWNYLPEEWSDNYGFRVAIIANRS